MKNVSKRRDSHEIVAKILESARGGAIKTHIMYNARLSCAQLNAYLSLLVERGLLENVATGEKRQMKQVLKTTERGAQFLENFRLLNP